MLHCTIKLKIKLGMRKIKFYQFFYFYTLFNFLILKEMFYTISLLRNFWRGIELSTECYFVASNVSSLSDLIKKKFWVSRGSRYVDISQPKPSKINRLFFIFFSHDFFIVLLNNFSLSFYWSFSRNVYLFFLSSFIYY